MKNNKNLGTILQILNILQSQTDEGHYITFNKIIECLKNKGINIRKYTLEKYLDELRALGYKIKTIKGTGTYLKNDNINANDVYVLLESLKRAGLIIEKDYIDNIKTKLLKQLNIFELEELKNKNMLL